MEISQNKKKFEYKVAQYNIGKNQNGENIIIPHLSFGKSFHYDYDPPDVINVLTEEKSKIKNDVSYLEIGVNQGHTFDKIDNISLKHGVDPYGSSENITHRMSSQMFFSMNSRFWKQKYDVIFIDAMHLYEFVDYEIKESLKILKEGGFILLHDTCPQNEMRQLVLENEYQDTLSNVICAAEKKRLNWQENVEKQEPLGWNGDVWKNVAEYRTKEEFTIFSIPSACISIISPRKMDKFYPNEKVILECDNDKIAESLGWHDYYSNFEILMNPVSMEYFKENILEYVGGK